MANIRPPSQNLFSAQRIGPYFKVFDWCRTYEIHVRVVKYVTTHQHTVLPPPVALKTVGVQYMHTVPTSVNADRKVPWFPGRKVGRRTVCKGAAIENTTNWMQIPADQQKSTNCSDFRRFLSGSDPKVYDYWTIIRLILSPKGLTIACKSSI